MTTRRFGTSGPRAGPDVRPAPGWAILFACAALSCAGPRSAPLPVAPPGGAAAPRFVVVECECQVPGAVDGEPQFRTLAYCVARAADPGSVCRRAPPAALRPACIARRIWEPTRCPEGVRQVTAARPAPR